MEAEKAAAVMVAEVRATVEEATATAVAMVVVARATVVVVRATVVVVRAVVVEKAAGAEAVGELVESHTRRTRPDNWRQQWR